jgi:aflatoxin B1 aldehyde reductase
VLYCHAPDKKTPIKEQAAAMDAEYRKGRFNQLGVCNFSTEMLEEWLQIANENGFVKPSVFQGQYNLLCRTYESTLFPLLRAHNISFVAYSPLAGGFLTGKVTFSKGPDDLQGTRFEVSETNFGGMRYRSFYDKPSMHAALRQVAPACESHGITLGNAAMRWLLFHSYLDGNRGDSVVIGPNTLPKVDEYVTAKDALNSVWENVKEDARPIVEY